MPESKQYLDPAFLRHELGSRVLAVAVPQVGGAGWVVYIDAVPGQNHDEEEGGVALTGARVRRRIALALFPQFDPAKCRN